MPAIKMTGDHKKKRPSCCAVRRAMTSASDSERQGGARAPICSTASTICPRPLHQPQAYASDQLSLIIAEKCPDVIACRYAVRALPTGFLHIGGARTALFNWLYAKHHGG